MRCAHRPTPDPSPQGGGERAEFAANIHSDSLFKQPAERKRIKPTLRTPEFRDFRRVLGLFSPSPNGRGSGAPTRRSLVTARLAKACAPSNVGRTPAGAPPRCFFRHRAVASEPDGHLRPGSRRNFHPALHPARTSPCGGSLLAEADGGSRCAGYSAGGVSPNLPVTAPGSAA